MSYFHTLFFWLEGDLKLVSFVFILSVAILTVFYFTIRYNKSAYKREQIMEMKNKQQRFFMALFGFSLMLLESLLVFFDIHRSILDKLNFPLCLGIASVYFLYDRFRFVKKYYREILSTLFVLYLLKLLAVLYFREITTLSTLFEFFLLYIISYNYSNKFKVYLVFNVGLLVSFSYLVIEKHISHNDYLFLSLGLTLTSFINYSRRINFYNVKDKYLFIDDIVNKSIALTIATNRRGEVIFCSKNVKEILGYETDEVMGMGFWKLTEDPEFVGESYHKVYVDNRVYKRKLKTKNGEYKIIEWIDKRYSDDMFVGIGTDVTQQIKIENQYQELVEKATDIIYEVNTDGFFTLVNNYTLKRLEYQIEELREIFFMKIVHPEYKEIVKEFYNNQSQQMEEFPALEFKVLSKSGREIWVSQKVTIRKNASNQAIGYTAIARDITEIKLLEIEKINRDTKLQLINEALNTLTFKKTKFENQDAFINEALELTARALHVNRVGFWRNENKTFKLKNAFSLYENEELQHSFFSIDEVPLYMARLREFKIITTSDISQENFYPELKQYCENLEIKSMVDIPINVNNQLYGILCLEQQFERRVWEIDDINFLKTVAEILTSAIESRMRMKAEEELRYKTKILTTIAENTQKVFESETNEEIFNKTINKLGDILAVDRIYFFEIDKSETSFSQKFEWCADASLSQINNPDLQQIPVAYVKDIITALKNNYIFCAHTVELDEGFVKEILAAQNIKSILVMPVIIRNKFHGFMGFDDCYHVRDWTADEIDILQLLVNNFSAAFEKNYVQKIISENEERFRLLADTIPGTVYLSNNDEKWTKIYLNDKVKSLTGYDKEDFLNHKIHFIDLVYPDDIQFVLEQQRNELNKGKSFVVRYRIKNKAGETVWVEEYGDAIYENGKVKYMGGVFIDITHKVQQENAIKEKEVAEEANRSKSMFLANMSHEIRTPLNGIIGFSEILYHTSLEEEQKKYVNSIHQSSKLLMGIVNDILDFSKIESGKMELHQAPVKLDAVCKETLETVKYLAEKKRLKLNFNFDASIQRAVLADEVRIKQVLINLLNNAVKFTEKGQITLTVKKIRKNNKHHKFIRFVVEDTGVGIKKQNINKIFEIFSQEDESTTRKYGGTGLGLAIVTKILALYDANLKVISRHGVGSIFYFDVKFPIASAFEPNEIVKVQTTTDEKSSVEHQKIKVLIVEDNKVNMLLTKTMIIKLWSNAEIIEAENGAAGVELFSKEQPDLVLMDVQMPVMNGYESTQKIRAIDNKNTPIIALTAGNLKGDKEKCIEAGMNDFLSKPLNKDNFYETIQKWNSVRILNSVQNN